MRMQKRQGDSTGKTCKEAVNKEVAKIDWEESRSGDGQRANRKGVRSSDSTMLEKARME